MALLNLVYFVPNSSHCINTHKIHSWYSIYTFSLIHKPSKGELIYSRRYVTPEPILWLQQVVYIGSEAQKALEGRHLSYVHGLKSYMSSRELLSYFK